MILFAFLACFVTLTLAAVATGRVFPGLWLLNTNIGPSKQMAEIDAYRATAAFVGMTKQAWKL